MNILICGDVVGSSGREVIENEVPKLKIKELLDFVIVNGENAANGFGITEKICKQFYSLGVDVITTGNHVWDQKEIIGYIENDKRLLRPINFSSDSPGNGYGIFSMNNGTHIVVINLICRLFMDLYDDPFRSIESILFKLNNRFEKTVIIVDVHGEATSEKMALGHYLDGKVAAVVGTHTHIPTADSHILEKGTFYQTDLGMCGDYNSIVGMEKNKSLFRFLHKHKKNRLEPASGNATLCGVMLKIDEKTQKVSSFKPLKIGGILGNK